MLNFGFILLVDDNPRSNELNAEIIRDTLEVDELVAKESSEDAIDYLKDRQSNGLPMPDLIFLDVLMPRYNGWDFLEQFRNNFGEARKGSVVMLTSSSDVRDMIKCAVHPEVQDYITKPLSDMETLRIAEQYSWQTGVGYN